MCEAGSRSQRMNRRSSPNRCLMRSWWRTVRTVDVLPIPPAPIRAIGVRFSANPTTSSINSSRPKKTLGGGGGDSPDTLDANIRGWIRRWPKLLTCSESRPRSELFGDVGRTSVTYRWILTISGLARFQHVLMHVGNDSVGIHNKLGLKRQGLVAAEQRDAEHTLKITRILLRSDFQPAIVPLSVLARRNREALPLPLCLMTFFCISATVLRSRTR